MLIIIQNPVFVKSYLREERFQTFPNHPHCEVASDEIGFEKLVRVVVLKLEETYRKHRH